MSFRNPIVAGNNLVRNAIQSPNYVAGSMGWIIRRDGSAEFSNAIFRGSVVISGSNNILMYSAAPAAGDLVISVAPNAGSDSFGNVYPAGFQILNHGGAGASGIAMGFAGTQPLQYFLNPVPNLRNDPALIVNTNGTGTAQFASFVFSSAEDATQGDYVAISLDSSSQDGSSHVAQITDAYVDSAGGAHPLILRGPGGTTIYAGTIAAVEPGTGTSRTNLAVGETWHAATLGSGWGPNGANFPVSYRVTADNMLEINGNALTTSTTPAAVIFTLPAGWTPAHTTRISVGGFNSATGNPETDYSVNVSSTGAVTINSPGPSASGVEMHFAHRVRMT